MSVSQDLQNLGDVLHQAFVVFPYNAITTPRQPDQQTSIASMAKSHDKRLAERKISDQLFQICQSAQSVSSLLAANPHLTPSEAWKQLYPHRVKSSNGTEELQEAVEGEVSPEELQRAAQCGKWGSTQPSELFLRMYHDALGSIEEDPSRAMVSPSLMGSCGTIPLTVISVIPDIVRHMSNVIVRAEREVFLATNYWQNSVASKYITNAMKELSRRAGERGTRVVMKIIYDRGSPKQVFEPHYIVSQKEYTDKAVGIPAPDEIPNIDLQVMNYHHPMLGTFHAKYMIADRKIAILQSNNIQDNDNLEMMIHLEGPIVDSLYDMALISWHKSLDPPLPSYNSPETEGGLGRESGSFGDSHAGIFSPEGTINGHHVVIDPKRIDQKKAYGPDDHNVRESGADNAETDLPNGAEKNGADAKTGSTTTNGTTHPAEAASSVQSAAPTTNGDASNGDEPKDDTQHVHWPGNTAEQPTRDYLDLGNQAIPQDRIRRPSSSTELLPEHSVEEPHYDNDIAGEVARVQSEVTPRSGETRIQAVSRLLNHTTNKGFEGSAPDCEPQSEMTPYIPHPAHEPFPIAMVCRSPYGPPKHKNVLMPQNAAWLSALRNAKKNVFIQSPTLNAEPLVPAIMDACERGIDVYCYICLGYNDAGELLPMQGGHNEMVAHRLHQSLSAAGRLHLHYFWYVAKDQTKPIVQDFKKRSCHIKLMIVDEHIGIMGNGNQDTQSWFHSQEINVMLDSVDICRAWIDGLRRNQNTHAYGALNRQEGIWKDGTGKEAEGAMGVLAGKFSWTKGLVGAVKRVQGTGGF